MNKNNSLFISIFVLLAIIVGYYVSHLGLYVDDFVLIFPAVLRSFASHFKQYTYDYGLFRPISLIYYYFIYFFYTLSPAISHLFVFMLHIFTSVVLFSILRRQSANKKLSLTIALLYLLHPFATEQYMWLSANPGTLVNLLFFLQICIILTFKRYRVAFFLVLLLSFLSVFIYESSFFLFIPLGYLFIMQHKNTIRFDKLKMVSLFLILTIPNLIYMITKLLFPPHVSQLRLPAESFIDLISNASTSLKNLGYLLSPVSFKHFWLDNIHNGFALISANTFVLILFLFATGLICYTLLRKNNSAMSVQKSSSYFWIAAFFSSLPPLFMLKDFNFPFRSLFLPSILLIISIAFFFLKKNWGSFKSVVIKLTCIIVILTYLLISVSIAQKYSEQFSIDTSLSQNIEDVVTANGFRDNYPSYVIIENFPRSQVYAKFLYADHILSCFNHYWCAQASLNMITGVVKNIGIEFTDRNFSSASEIPYEDFIKKRPLIILQLFNNNFEVKAIYR